MSADHTKDFAYLAARIRRFAARGEPMSRALLTADLETVLVALDIAGAAIAYVHRDTQPLSPESAAAWLRLKQAVGDFEGRAG